MANMPRRVLQGVVVSNKAAKTVIVLVPAKQGHALQACFPASLLPAKQGSRASST